MQELAFTPDGRGVVVVTYGEARVWDWHSGKPLSEPLRFQMTTEGESRSDAAQFNLRLASKRIRGSPYGRGWHTRLSFSPDGRRMLVALGPVARLFDAATFEPLSPPLVHADVVLQAAFRGDGRVVVTTSDDGAARLWDGADGRPLTAPLEHETGVMDSAFSPDGRLLATCTAEFAVRVWEVASGELVSPSLPCFPIARGDVSGILDPRRQLVTGEPSATPFRVMFPSIAFTPDGRRIVVVSTQDNAVYTRDVTPDARPAEDLIALAHAVAGKQLDATGGIVPMQLAKFRETWATLKARYPGDFALSRDDVRAWGRREATACEEAGQLASAVAHLDLLIRGQPSERGLLEERARLQQRRGDWDAALKDRSRVIELHPKDAKAWTTRASTHAARRSWHEVVADCTRALELEPANAATWHQRGRARFGLREYPQAVADYTKAIEYHPGLTDAWGNRGEAHLRLKEWDKAIADFTKAIEGSDKASWLWQGRGVAYRQLGQPDKAGADFARAAQLAGKNPTKWNQVAAFYRAWRQWDKAIEAYGQVIELQHLFNRTAQPFLDRGLMHAELSQWDKAAADFETARATSGAPLDAWRYQGLIHLQKADREGYRKLLASMLERFGKTIDPLVGNNLARHAVHVSDSGADVAVILSLAERAVEAAPKNVNYLRTLGAAYYRAGRFADAIRRLEESAALRGGPEGDAWEGFFLALARHRLGKSDEARRWLARAVAWMESRKDDLTWAERLELSLLRAEAEQAIEGKEKK